MPFRSLQNQNMSIQDKSACRNGMLGGRSVPLTACLCAHRTELCPTCYQTPCGQEHRIQVRLGVEVFIKTRISWDPTKKLQQGKFLCGQSKWDKLKWHISKNVQYDSCAVWSLIPNKQNIQDIHFCLVSVILVSFSKELEKKQQLISPYIIKITLHQLPFQSLVYSRFGPSNERKH